MVQCFGIYAALQPLSYIECLFTSGCVELDSQCSHLGCSKEQNSMKCVLGVRSWQLLVIVMLFSGPLLAQSSGVLYPGSDTTINGNVVYFSVLLADGYQVKTGRQMSKITLGGAELDISPNTTVVIKEPLLLICGTVVIRSGRIQINDGKSTTSFAIGESAHSAADSCSSALPDAPSVARTKQFFGFMQASQRNGQPQAAASNGIWNMDGKVADWPYWTMNGVMVGSSILSAQLTQNCLQAGACDFVPNAFRSRVAMYGAGLPAVAGVSYLGYRLKAKGYRWWFIPAALVTSGNIVVSTHAAHYSH